MTEQVKRQLIKALAYGKTNDEIKECMEITENDINSVTAEEIEAEKAYYREMGYIK
jgi:hypothetical protein|nr:MAG TPA: RNA polymerase alpha subunit [Caudoviricetes sp.]